MWHLPDRRSPSPGQAFPVLLSAWLLLALLACSGAGPGPPPPPQATITPGWSLPAPPRVTLGQSCTASVPAQPGCAYAWSIADGAALLVDPRAPTVTLTPTLAGPLQLQCRVTDARGLSRLGTASLTVVAGAVLNASPAILTPGQSTFLRATFTGAAGLLQPGAIAIASRQPVPVQPARTTTYTLLVDGAATAAVTVRVETFTPAFVYVANQGTGITAFALDPASGRLTPVPGPPSPATVEQVASDPQGRFLVAAGQANGVYVYTIDGSTGALAPAPGSPFSPAAAMVFCVAVDPLERFVYASAAGQILGFLLDNGSGALTPMAGSPFSTGHLGQGELLVHPSGQYLYAAAAEDGQLDAFSIDPASGALTRLPEAPYDTGVALPTGLTVDPTGGYLFVKGEQAPSQLAAFALDPGTGVPSLAGAPVPLPGGGASHGLACHPGQDVLYTAFYDDPAADAGAYGFDRTALAGLLLDLTPLAGAPYDLFPDHGSDTVIVERSGQFAFATGWTDSTIARMRVADSGALTRLDGGPLSALEADTAPVGVHPMAIAVAGTLTEP